MHPELTDFTCCTFVVYTDFGIEPFRTIAVICSGSAKYILHYFAIIVNDFSLNLM